MSQRSVRFRSWNQLKRAIELKFGPSLYESPRKLLFKLQQLGMVSDYYSEFIALANRTQIDPPDALEDCFISGLKSDIRREVKAQCPPSLMRAVTLARLYEDKFSSVPISTYGPASPRPQPTPAVAISSNRPIQRNTLPPLLPNPPQRPALPLMKSSVRKLSPAEIHSKWEKGLCYWCDEKFSAAHRCPNRQYMQLQLVLDDADGGDTGMQESLESKPSLEALESQVVEHHFSYNAMHGTSGPALILVNVIINGLKVHALIDGGSSDSYIQPRIAKFLNLRIEPALGFKVIVGSFEVLPVESHIASLDVNLSGCLVSIPEVYVLHVAKGELVIGSTWLQTLKAHIVDYNSSFLHFWHKGEFVAVQGYKSPPSSQAQFHHIRRLVSTDVVAAVFTLELQQLDRIVKPPLQLPKALHPALPSGLPPRRFQDHGIPLIEGAAPVKSHPYRYPHNLKAQIETMVSEMLQEGIIQPSKSPFSSPIILVKKKDGTWRFCTDYRALNAITVKDCFPIPTVDELLDELFGATIFLKLDLRSGYHQILVKPKDRFKTAFRTHQGLYEWGGGVHMETAKVHAILEWPQPASKLPPTLQKKSAYIREFYAITEALAKFRHYLLRKRFILHTDHQSLKALLEQDLHTPEQHKWLHKLLGFDFEIHYKAGTENVATDAFSRSFFGAWSAPRVEWLDQLRTELVADEDLRDIRQYVLSYCICQQAKVENKAPAGLLKPLPIPSQVWKDIAMDFIVSLPVSSGYSVIMVVVDRLTKYAHFLPLKQDFNSKTVAETFINNVVKLHGFSKSIVSDRDRVEFWYNSSWHSSIKMTPFKALYGRDPPTLARYELSSTDNPSLQEWLQNRDHLLDQLKFNLERSQQYMKYVTINIADKLNFRRAVCSVTWPQCQVQWGQGNLTETTWEDVHYSHKLFPEFNLEDKVVADGEGNDVNIANEEYINKSEEYIYKSQAGLEGRVVTNHGHVTAGPPISGSRKSTMEKINSKWLEDYDH
ncbi:uncharacterized protein [Arachis hypogaea]|uniref:uncharacterized protein n=1 Tax=Arachis hypogaea TaxID=3818 RepID=UPI003B224C4F